jgi:hypothetical protein
MDNKRIIIIERDHEISEKLEVTEDTLLTIGNYQIRVSELTGLVSYSKTSK